MGYCHYWGRPMELSPEQFISYVFEVKQLRDAVKPRFWFFGGVKITGGLRWGGPTFTDRIINFNGRPGCENFLVTRIYSEKHKNRSPKDDGLYWDYVKTNQNPYDVVVTAALLSLLHHVPEAAVESDGDITDWKQGIELYERVTRRKALIDFLG